MGGKTCVNPFAFLAELLCSLSRSFSGQR